MSETSAHLRPVLRKLGIGERDVLTVEPLTGGVSSDIMKITTCSQTFALKRALPKLLRQSFFAPMNQRELTRLLERP